MIISVKAAFGMQYNLLNGGRKGSVAEWSKALVEGAILFGGVGSNPTAANSPLHDSGKLQLHFVFS